MELTQQYATDALVATSGIIDARTAELPGVAQSGAKRQLDVLVADLVTHRSDQVEQSRHARATTQVHYANRRTLLKQHMAGIVSVARAAGDEYPDLTVVRMPKPNCNVVTLLDAATTVRNGAAVHADVFVAAGLPADFIAQLDAAVAALMHALQERKEAFGRKVGATKGIRATIAAARKQVQILDKLVRNAAAGNEALLRNWEQVKRFPKPTTAGRSRSALALAGTPVTPAVAAPVSGVVGSVPAAQVVAQNAA